MDAYRRQMFCHNLETLQQQQLTRTSFGLEEYFISAFIYSFGGRDGSNGTKATLSVAVLALN
jgi:hypothetical protein